MYFLTYCQMVVSGDLVANNKRLKSNYIKYYSTLVNIHKRHIRLDYLFRDLI